MKSRIKLVLVFLIILAGSLSLIQLVRAEETKYKVFLPLVINIPATPTPTPTLTPTPTPVPRIEITYVPPIIPAYSVYPLPDDLRYQWSIHGYVLNVDPSTVKIVIYDYYDNKYFYQEPVWCMLNDKSFRTAYELHQNLNEDGSFSELALPAINYGPSYYLRFYLLRKEYIPPLPKTLGVYCDLELPPDPPTRDVLTMVEIERFPPDGEWKIIQRKP